MCSAAYIQELPLVEQALPFKCVAGAETSPSLNYEGLVRHRRQAAPSDAR